MIHLGEVLTHTVPTKNNISTQAFVTKSGAIVSSSCDQTNPSILTVYDRDGRMGSSLKGNLYEYLFAAADDQDRIYVATVNTSTSKVSIMLYELEDLNLIDKYRFEQMPVSIGASCSMASLSRNLLALAGGNKLYFIKVCA